MSATGDLDVDWYATLESGTAASRTLEQGDILRGYPLSIAVDVATDRPRLKVEERDVIILTQTCDIPKVSQQTLLLAELVSYDDLYRSGQDSQARSSGFRRSLVQGLNVAFFLLRPTSQVPEFSWTLASFRDLHVEVKGEVERFVESGEPRLRLNSPYKEHLSQAFARFMMRVGLPITANDFEGYKPDSS